MPASISAISAQMTGGLRPPGEGEVSGTGVSVADRSSGEKNAGMDKVSISKEGQEAADKANDPNKLTEDEEREVEDLKKRDREVKAHEQAHKTAGGRYAGAATYTYETGPDNKRYATSGEVSIDVAPVPDDPQATIVKMDIVKRAALAPARPSGTDRSVYAQASRQQTAARQELVSQKMEEMQQSSGSEDSGKADRQPEVSAPSEPIALIA